MHSWTEHHRDKEDLRDRIRGYRRKYGQEITRRKFMGVLEGLMLRIDRDRAAMPVEDRGSSLWLGRLYDDADRLLTVMGKEGLVVMGEG